MRPRVGSDRRIDHVGETKVLIVTLDKSLKVNSCLKLEEEVVIGTTLRDNVDLCA